MTHRVKRVYKVGQQHDKAKWQKADQSNENSGFGSTEAVI
ncbi:hypothetical protein EVA_07716 [gut metagenome]|uniref:Uncharacterized protein n=1 Tax=gut metagenome TaxID=749906 RepID=J9GUP0_9ZZZZ